MKYKSLKVKLVLVTGTALLVTVFAMAIISGIMSRKNAIKSANLLALEKAKNYSGEISSIINSGSQQLQIVTRLLSMSASDNYDLSLSREEVTEWFKLWFEDTRNFGGTYTMWEPNAYDGNDEAYKGTTGHDNTGRFSIYWWEGGLAPLSGYNELDYYQKPLQTKSLYVTNPHMYDNTLLGSINAPIIIDNQFAGIAGMNLVADFLQEIAEGFDGFEGNATIALIAYDGTVGGHSQHPEWAGKNISECYENADDIQNKLNNRFEGVIDNKNNVVTYVPVETGSDPWQVQISVPRSYLLQEANRVLLFQLLLGLIILGLALAAIYFKLNDMIKPILILSETSKRIASGDLRDDVQISSNDEIGILAVSFQQMIVQLRSIAKNIGTNANLISTASQQIRSSSLQVANGATEQASAAEEVSSSIEEMTANIEQNTENAGATKTISAEATEGMNSMSHSFNETFNSIMQITEKISIINDIAFQTNILALNAAVEAARAGEHGKGFAVVAGEVRKLAERSKIAADEIVHLADSSKDVTKEAHDYMGVILPKIKNTSQLLVDISASSSEQLTGISQINQSVTQFTEVSQQNASASEELSANSEQLADQAEDLLKLVDIFKYND